MNRILNYLTLLGFALVLGGCATMHVANPVTDASRPETVAYALYGGYVIAEESAADIASNVNTPEAVKATLKAADIKVAPVAEQLEPAAKEVEKIRADIAAGGGSPSLLQTTIIKLNDWISQVAPLLRDLTDAVRGAKKS